MLASKRNPKFSSYTDGDIQRMYARLDDVRKEFILELDMGKNVERELDAVDLALFELDDELCARGY